MSSSQKQKVLKQFQDGVTVVDNKDDGDQRIKDSCQNCTSNNSPEIYKVPINLHHTFVNKQDILKELQRFGTDVDPIESGKNLPFVPGYSYYCDVQHPERIPLMSIEKIDLTFDTRDKKPLQA